MGTTVDKLNKILESKNAIKQALINKGYSSDEVGDIFSQYGYLIENIPSGGGEIEAALTNAKYDYVKDYLLDMIAESYEITKDWTDYSALDGGYYSHKNNVDIWFVPIIEGQNINNLYAFSYCKRLLFVPKEIKTTNSNCSAYFAYCSRLLFIDIPTTIMQANDYINNMFYECTSLLICKNLDIRQNKDYQYYFYNCKNLEEVYGTSTGGGKYNNMFNGCSSLKKIEGIEFDFTNCTSSFAHLNSMFNGCSSLEEVRFKENTLNIGGLNLSSCTSLSHNSLLSIINACAQVTETQTLTLGADNLAKLSEEEKAIATNKGWTLA